MSDNRYATMVWDGLRSAGVPIGAELMIVGHSFGADTALDLAADPMFNGAAGFAVTHVVAAGYHSVPQLAHVDQRTEVLVLQNYRDSAVIAEAVGRGPVTDAVEEGRMVFGDLRQGDPVGAVEHLGGAVSNVADVIMGGLGLVADRAGTLGRIGAGVAAIRPGWVAEGVGDLFTLRVGVNRVTEQQIVDVFRGGSDGAGHATSNYVDHVATTEDPTVEAFLGSFGAGAAGGSGTAWAIDVSVPFDRRTPQPSVATHKT